MFLWIDFVNLLDLSTYLKITINVIALRLPSILCPSKNNPIAIDHKITPFTGFVCKPNKSPKIKTGLWPVYEQVKSGIYSFVQLYKLVKAAGMNTQHVVNVLKIANNHLPAVEQRYENLTRQVYSLEGDKRNSAMILQELSSQITELQNTSESYHSSCEEERRQMGELYEKRILSKG